MPSLVRFVIRHALIGIAVGWTMVLAMLVFDFAGLATLIFASDFAAIAVAMLLIGFGITFGSVQVGLAVMGMGDDNRPRRGRRILPIALPAPVTVRARTVRR